jgi:hypothetical protein
MNKKAKGIIKMELLTKKETKLFEEYEGIILNAINKRMDRNKSLDKFVENFIEFFRTDEEKKQIKELTFQIDSTINSIYMQKINMLKDIDLSYIYSSHLLTLTTERAKLYLKAIDRIEIHYESKKISNYLKNYKNL